MYNNLLKLVTTNISIASIAGVKRGKQGGRAGAEGGRTLVLFPCLPMQRRLTFLNTVDPWSLTVTKGPQKSGRLNGMAVLKGFVK